MVTSAVKKTSLQKSETADKKAISLWLNEQNIILSENKYMYGSAHLSRQLFMADK